MSSSKRVSGKVSPQSHTDDNNKSRSNYSTGLFEILADAFGPVRQPADFLSVPVEDILPSGLKSKYNADGPSNGGSGVISTDKLISLERIVRKHFEGFDIVFSLVDDEFNYEFIRDNTGAQQYIDTLIMELVEKEFKVSMNQLRSQSRDRELVDARMAYVFFCLHFKVWPSLDALGSRIGRDHATVLHYYSPSLGKGSVINLLETDALSRQKYINIYMLIRKAFPNATRQKMSQKIRKDIRKYFTL